MFVVEKEKPKIKKKCKNLSPFLGFTFSSRGQGNKKKKKAISSLPNCFSPGPSVVEEDLEDLEGFPGVTHDVHMRAQERLSKKLSKPSKK